MKHTGSFAALYERGPNWFADRPLREQPLSEHLEYLLGLHAQDKLLMGGPYGDETGGLVILNVGTLEEAQALIAADPAIVAGTLKAAVKTWNRVV